MKVFHLAMSNYNRHYVTLVNEFTTQTDNPTTKTETHDTGFNVITLTVIYNINANLFNIL